MKISLESLFAGYVKINSAYKQECVLHGHRPEVLRKVHLCVIVGVFHDFCFSVFCVGVMEWMSKLNVLEGPQPLTMILAMTHLTLSHRRIRLKNPV